MSKRYNVYFSGQVITGFDPLAVRESLGKLFNADAQTLDKLFSGKPRMIKRDCDEATAQKYRSAMERAGAEPLIEAVATASSAADKIAALAAAPADKRFRESADSEENAESTQDNTPRAAAAPETQAETQPAPAAKTAPVTASGDDEIALAPPETAVLLPEERAKPTTREVDTSGLSLDASGERFAQPAPPPPAAPDTSHLNVGDVGELIPNLPSTKTPVSPNIDALGLSPEGTDFSDCADEAPPSPDLDLSGMEVAPAGADVLEQQYRKPDTASAPDTDHLSLDD